MSTTRNPEVRALATYLLDSVRADKKLFFVTTKYKQFRKRTNSSAGNFNEDILEQAVRKEGRSQPVRKEGRLQRRASAIAKNLHRFYIAILQYTLHAHRYHHEKYIPLQPAMFAFLDIEGSKLKKDKMKKPSASPQQPDLHHHAILVCGRTVAGKLDPLCADATLCYQLAKRRKDAHIQALDIRPITPTIKSITRVVQYAMKYALANRHVHLDAMTVFPIASSERQRPRIR